MRAPGGPCVVTVTTGNSFHSVAIVPKRSPTTCCALESGLRLPLPSTIPYPHIPPDILHIGADPHSVVRGHVRHGLRRRRHARTLFVSVAAARCCLVRRSTATWIAVIGTPSARVSYTLSSMAASISGTIPWRRCGSGMGLSFHGAILGMAVASAVFARRANLPWLGVVDTIAVCGAPGLFFVRLGNFINAELYGRVTNVPGP